jgi:hypothetical protein
MRLDKRRWELQEARKIASRRSGARGKEARLEEIKAEERVKEAELLCENHCSLLKVLSSCVNQTRGN